ncbi:MAG: nitroreductase family protein [Bacteroidales bacterium]|jgi:nitroreductase|nr:nitroreductase family protein [Bacteroidales bacterium]MDZ4058642.1 nitroreductase family protein [Bacteroidales bacterium]
MIPFEKNRSYRRFFEDSEISTIDLRSMVEAARLSPSSRNVQPIKFFICNNRETNSLIFPHLGWAGYLKDWDGPQEGERPGGYIILLHDKSISATYSCDHGIFAQSILLRAVELGFGGCMIASFKKESLTQLLSLPDNLEIILVIALGRPKEIVVIDEVKDGDIKYWRDSEGVHHVPKRALDELIWTMPQEER